MNAYNNDLDFNTLLKEDKKVLEILNAKEIDDCFTLDYYFKNVEYIYKRCKIEG